MEREGSGEGDNKRFHEKGRRERKEKSRKNNMKEQRNKRDKESGDKFKTTIANKGGTGRRTE